MWTGLPFGGGVLIGLSSAVVILLAVRLHIVAWLDHQLGVTMATIDYAAEVFDNVDRGI